MLNKVLVLFIIFFLLNNKLFSQNKDSLETHYSLETNLEEIVITGQINNTKIVNILKVLRKVLHLYTQLHLL